MRTRIPYQSITIFLAFFLIAIPVSYYFMHHWLQNYVYRTTISAPLLVTAALLTIIITFATISYKAYQAATMNPARALKTE